MTDEKDIVERLREKDKDWQELCDGWVASWEALGRHADDDMIASLRKTDDAEAASAIEALREHKRLQAEDIMNLGSLVHDENGVEWKQRALAAEARIKEETK